jgi:DNA-binding response OmpR family regulator
MHDHDADPAAVRVLLIEDDAGDAVLMRELLRDAGSTIELVHATSVAEAEAGAAREADCVLVDLGLPDALGAAAVARVRAAAPAVAIIVHTGLDDDRRRAETAAAGAQDYVVKGVLDGDELVEVIEAAIASRRRDCHSGV